MAGNVWEWCVTGFETQTNTLDVRTLRRVLRGGAWYRYVASNPYRCDVHNGDEPYFGEDTIGFRIVREK